MSSALSVLAFLPRDDEEGETGKSETHALFVLPLPLLLEESSVNATSPCADQSIALCFLPLLKPDPRPCPSHPGKSCDAAGSGLFPTPKSEYRCASAPCWAASVQEEAEGRPTSERRFCETRFASFIHSCNLSLLPGERGAE